jgi:DNA replication protein DnaC
MRSLTKILEHTQLNSKPARLTNKLSIQLPMQKQALDYDAPCSVCRGVGFLRRDVPIDHPDFGKPIPCECRKSKQVTQRLEQIRSISNLESMGRFTFDNFTYEGHRFGDDKRRRSLYGALQTACQYAENPQGWLVFLGGYGCGKTHLAVAIANHVISRGYPAFFVVVPDLLDHLRTTFNPNNNSSYDERFAQIRNAPLLILDDLGAHSSTSWAQEKLFQLFNHRYNAQLPTVITTNYDLDRIDIRIRSRLVDQDIAQLVLVNALDYRQGTDVELSNLSSLLPYQNKTFETFNTYMYGHHGEYAENLNYVVDVAYNYANKPSGWLVITGPYGCGKTHIAAAIANKRDSMGDEDVLFVTVPDLLDYLRAAFSPNSTIPYDRRFDEIRKTHLLVLDDLGAESATPWAEEKLYQLFNYRYNNVQLMTIITIPPFGNKKLNPRFSKMISNRERCILLKIRSPNDSEGESENDIWAHPKVSRHRKRYLK